MSRNKPLPTLTDLIDHKIDLALSSFNAISLGTVQSYDKTTQTVSISMNYQKIYKDAKVAENNIDMIDEIVEYPILTTCPAFILSGGDSYLSMPIAKGDTCLVLFCDREIDTWYRTGVKTFPQSERMHSLTDAIALVGIKSSQNKLTGLLSDIASLMDKTGERLSQSGDLKATARSTAPSGWLLCYGQAVSRTTYDQLYATIGTTYGAGDGSTTFNVPDLRGRVPVGLNNMGGSDGSALTSTFTPNRDTLGGVVGEESHLLTGQESGIQQHSHTVPAGANGNLTDGYILNDGTSLNGTPRSTNTTGHTNAINNHNNVQPGMMVNWLIKI